jgi:hypothetical protein
VEQPLRPLHTRILFHHSSTPGSEGLSHCLSFSGPSWSPRFEKANSCYEILSLGIQPPQASLGSSIAAGAGQINPIRICWWRIVFPAGFLAVTLLALNFFGDGLRDALDPRSEQGT